MDEKNYLKDELYTLIQSDTSIFEFIHVNSLDGLWYWDLENPEQEWMSPRFWEVLGYDPSSKQHLSSEWQDIIFQDDLALAIENFHKHLADPNHPYDQIVRYIHKNGSTVWIRCRGIAIRNDKGMATRMLGAHNDVTSVINILHEKEENNQLAIKYKEELKKRKISEENERVVNQYLNIVNDYVILSTTDLKGKILTVSQAFCDISGYSEEELVGQSHNIIRHPSMTKAIFKDLWGTLKRNQTWKGELCNLRKDGSFYWVSITITPTFDNQNQKIGYMAIREDITDKKRVEELSVTDSLTGLYNRRYFDSSFFKIINGIKRNNQCVSFILLDIDYFKYYNDTYGHLNGDKALIKIAHTIKKQLKRANDFSFRVGGEEFIIIFESKTPHNAKQLAQKICDEIESLKLTHEKSKTSQYVTVSMGLVYFDPNKNPIKSMEQVYKEADALLYDAKEKGRNRISCIF